MTRFVGIVSGKGGVGRTTIAINLSTALHKFNREIILVDAHLNQPHIALFLGSHNVEKSLHHAIKNKINIKDLAYKHHSGLKLIPGSFIEEHQKEIQSHKFKDVLLDLIGTAEIVIVDMGSEGQIYDNIFKSMDEIIVVVTPDLPSVVEGVKTIKKAKDSGVRILGTIVNRIMEDEYDLHTQNIKTMMEYRILGEIHESKYIRSSLCKDPVVVLYPESRASLEFKEIARNLIEGKLENNVRVSSEKSK